MRLPRAVHPTALFALSALLVAGCSSDSGPKPYVLEQNVSTLGATVDAIDQGTRRITLSGDSGNTVTFTVDERVKNLDRIKVGDRVKAAYVETVEIQVRDRDGTGGDATTAGNADWERTQDGTIKRQSTVTSIVEKVNRKKGAVALRLPGGRVYSFHVRNPRNLENVKVGDEVVATYREALAVAIDPVE